MATSLITLWAERPEAVTSEVRLADGTRLGTITVLESAPWFVAEYGNELNVEKTFIFLGDALDWFEGYARMITSEGE